MRWEGNGIPNISYVQDVIDLSVMPVSLRTRERPITLIVTGIRSCPGVPIVASRWTNSW